MDNFARWTLPTSFQDGDSAVSPGTEHLRQPHPRTFNLASASLAPQLLHQLVDLSEVRCTQRLPFGLQSATGIDRQPATELDAAGLQRFDFGRRRFDPQGRTGGAVGPRDQL